jgi:hypothetical protein
MARGIDCVTTLTQVSAEDLKARGIDFSIRYLGSVTANEVDIILSAGLAFMPVTYGLKHGTEPTKELGTRFGSSSARQARDAGVGLGATVWLDLEDMAGTPQEVIDFVDAWATVILGAGFQPGLYVGAGALLTSQQLYALKVVRYWQSLSKEIDVRGQLAEPACGWCMIQLYPTIVVAGVSVDIDVIQQDYRQRTPMWTRKIA